MFNKKLSILQRGHQRSPSDTQAFKERTKRDALIDLETELSKIAKTATGYEKENIEQQNEGFKKLFERFLEEGGPSLNWDQIQKLPDDAVKILTFIVLYYAHLKKRF